MEDVTKHYLISGRVQGVGFRAYAKRTAGELGLRGWVRNLKDGRVEAVAQGTSEILGLFAENLKATRGPALVESLHVEDWTSSAACNGFTVQKDGLEPCCEN